MTELRKCPFCGVIPRLYWEAWKEISESAGTYVLEANHKNSCFIYRMNGMNSKGRMSAFNKECLIEAWNRRVGDTE